MRKIGLIILLGCTALIISSCSNKHFDESVENMNKGEISIYADDAYQSIVSELVKSYENVYPESKINVTFASEKAVIEAMMSGKTRMMITGKQLTQAEQDKIEQANEIKPQINPIATEAIAIITSVESPDSVFDFDAFMTSRKNAGAKLPVNNKYVFVKGQTSFVNQITGGTTGNLSDLFSLESADTLIRYISQTTNSYGFISFAMISDMDDPAAREILNQIKVLKVMKQDSTGVKRVYELSQSSIAANEYPLQRSIYVVKGNMAQSLGTGFVNFMYRSKASRIFLKAGLIPAVMPERQLLIKE